MIPFYNTSLVIFPQKNRPEVGSLSLIHDELRLIRHSLTDFLRFRLRT